MIQRNESSCIITIGQRVRMRMRVENYEILATFVASGHFTTSQGDSPRRLPAARMTFAVILGKKRLLAHFSLPGRGLFVGIFFVSIRGVFFAVFGEVCFVVLVEVFLGSSGILDITDSQKLRMRASLTCFPSHSSG
jgi:hypothetical protein